MKEEFIKIKELNFPVYSLNTVIVGTGAAGFNAADTLFRLGMKDIAMVTEGKNMGTSRNTGSDKQTYYKLSLSGAPDSVYDLAQTLFDGGAKHGDIALVEAAYSAKSFYKLTELGVPFPQDEYGQYAGYKTDHDPRMRATSAGPLTSKYMVEALEQSVIDKNIKIFDGYTVIGLMTEEGHSKGLIALDKSRMNDKTFGLTLFNCTNVIFATGGPAGMYEASVYPQSQTGSLGLALEQGVKGVNLTESQFGIASTKFRWNLSGTYQQVIPVYISTDTDGLDEREFLNDYLTPEEVFSRVFLKGYEWPFDVRKLSGSSLIDLLVYQEIYIKGRKVFLDFRRNPQGFSFSLLTKEAYSYLENSNALTGTPVERLRIMNEPAYRLYQSHHIDLEREPVEINICAQHANGGLLCDSHWESNIRHFFPVGEAAGTFGVYRPGGAALNATQTGACRAAEFITEHYTEPPAKLTDFITIASIHIQKLLADCETILNNPIALPDVRTGLKKLKERMSRYGGIIRNREKTEEVLKICKEELDIWPHGFSVKKPEDLILAFQYHDLTVTQYTYMLSFIAYMERTESSRGSAIITDSMGTLPLKGLDERFRCTVTERPLFDEILEVTYNGQVDWIKVRPVPNETQWFETVWKNYRERKNLK